MTDISVIHKLDIKSAPLPAVYEKATMAISECVNLDECKEWSNKAQALASYARQAADDKLEQMCKRIRARAIRRCGVLLKMFDGRGRPEINSVDAHTNLSKVEAGKAAGLSKNQQVTANRLANIPEDDFDAQVEQAKVPTVTELSEQGKLQAAANREHLSKPKPEGFAEAIHFKGALNELWEFVDCDPQLILNGMDDDNKTKCVSMMETVKTWFDDFISESKD